MCKCYSKKGKEQSNNASDKSIKLFYINSNLYH